MSKLSDLKCAPVHFPVYRSTEIDQCDKQKRVTFCGFFLFRQSQKTIDQVSMILKKGKTATNIENRCSDNVNLNAIQIIGADDSSGYMVMFCKD